MITDRIIELTFAEDDRHTDAEVTLTLRGVIYIGRGRARRNPADPSMPLVGEELAAARALNDLSHRLVDAVTEAISEREGHPAHVRA